MLVATVVALLIALPGTSVADAAEGGWSFDPASWDFGTVIPGTGPSPPKAFTLANTGDVGLSVIFVSVAGNEGAGFELAGSTCGGGLEPGATCQISVTFDPSTAGPKQGQLGVASQDGSAPPTTAALSGTGAGPVVSIAPSRQSFEPLELGAGPSPPRTMTITNEGQLDLAIASISIQTDTIYNYPGAAAEQFELAGGSCRAGLLLPPKGTCTVDATFSPTAPGAHSARLRLADNAPGSPHVADLEGFGIAPPWQPPPPALIVVPRASILHRPARRTASRRAVFWFRGSPTASIFTCKLDRRPFRTCRSPARYRLHRRGRHRFAVRALDGNGRGGPATVFRWRVTKYRGERRRSGTGRASGTAGAATSGGSS